MLTPLYSIREYAVSGFTSIFKAGAFPAAVICDNTIILILRQVDFSCNLCKLEMPVSAYFVVARMGDYK
jgi:hypothetical protein